MLQLHKIIMLVENGIIPLTQGFIIIKMSIVRFYYYKNSNPEVISYNTNPKFNIFQDFTYNSTIDSIISENIFTIGTGFTSYIRIV